MSDLELNSKNIMHEQERPAWAWVDIFNFKGHVTEQVIQAFRAWDRDVLAALKVEFPNGGFDAHDVIRVTERLRAGQKVTVTADHKQ